MEIGDIKFTVTESFITEATELPKVLTILISWGHAIVSQWGYVEFQNCFSLKQLSYPSLFAFTQKMHP
ncbi:hypothetical protein, partial [Actinobacillus pleuropneumoniae]|uniref:hypothetical protein n=1 Tax=Actinobacillus pleuropneumoniae TaxID=715 RepID=UPI00227B8926